MRYTTVEKCGTALLLAIATGVVIWLCVDTRTPAVAPSLVTDSLTVQPSDTVPPKPKKKKQRKKKPPRPRKTYPTRTPEPVPIE